MTTNRTLDRKIVATTSGFATIASHALVVVDDHDGGRRLHQTVLPPEQFRKPRWWAARGTLLPYQVTLDERLRDDFSHMVPHADGVHCFTLEFELSYCVVRDRVHLLVTRLDDDPLGAVEGEIKRVLSPPVQALDWAELEDLTDVSQLALHSRSLDDSGGMVVNLERIQVFARSFGIDARKITVTRRLADVDLGKARIDDALRRLQVDAREQEARRRVGARLAVIQSKIDRERDAELHALEIEQIWSEQGVAEVKVTAQAHVEAQRARASAVAKAAGMLEAGTEGMRAAIRRITEQASSFEEMERQIVAAVRAAATAQRAIPGLAGAPRTGGPQPSGDAARQVASPAAGRLVDAPAPTAFDELPRTIADVLARACEVAAALPIPELEQRQLLAAVLRLQAARMVAVGAGEHAGEIAGQNAADIAAEIERHRVELQRLHRVHCQDMSDNHRSFIAALMNGSGLAATR